MFWKQVLFDQIVEMADAGLSPGEMQADLNAPALLEERAGRQVFEAELMGLLFAVLSGRVEVHMPVDMRPVYLLSYPILRADSGAVWVEGWRVEVAPDEDRHLNLYVKRVGQPSRVWVVDEDDVDGTGFEVRLRFTAEDIEAEYSEALDAIPN